MRKGTKAGRVAACLLGLTLMAMPVAGMAMDHGGMDMGGMQHDAKAGGHDMAKMGDKLYDGKLGMWKAEARLMDMKAHMAAMPSGMKMEGAMPNSHHLAVTVTDAKSKKTVTEGKGTVTVTGPDGKAV